ncbi:kynurenine 3-monooxygenase [Pocillopora verrucosa]|uniref:kynurenine 3-monooxygenase n=1 Tax=Pocillopora verrucosa TaxID=203993 RepID=UPI003342A5B1
MAADSFRDEQITPTKVIVVGGGLVGSLCAIFLAKRGFHVDLYEARQDPRLVEFVGGRSTNLALSTRGAEALRAVGALESISPLGVDIYGRKIHPQSGDITTLFFEHGEHHPMMAMERRKVNEKLLSVAETFPNVHLHFKHKLVSANLEKGHLVLSCPEGMTVEVDAQLVIGADGAHSTLRSEMMKKPRFDFSQEYISHGYKEFQLLPNKNGEYAIVEDYLHVWPRDGFMLIAIPNKDPSFTCTLFMPFENFDSLKTKEDVLSFFNSVFPDFVQLMGEERILEDFFKNPVWHTVSIKCKPYHFSDKVLIIGDAAHAMVPFFGQGMNSGFEDCLILDRLLDKHGNNFGAVLEEYSKVRNKDAEAICDMSMDNYLELRSLVNSFWFLLERKAMYALNRLMPKTFIPLHTMVTYTHIPYHEVVKRNQWQEKMVRLLLMTGSITGLAGLMVILKTWRFRIS